MYCNCLQNHLPKVLGRQSQWIVFRKCLEGCCDEAIPVTVNHHIHFFGFWKVGILVAEFVMFLNQILARKLLQSFRWGLEVFSHNKSQFMLWLLQCIFVKLHISLHFLHLVAFNLVDLHFSQESGFPLQHLNLLISRRLLLFHLK
jgi:hypothetical protein